MSPRLQICFITLQPVLLFWCGLGLEHKGLRVPCHSWHSKGRFLSCFFLLTLGGTDCGPANKWVCHSWSCTNCCPTPSAALYTQVVKTLKASVANEKKKLKSNTRASRQIFQTCHLFTCDLAQGETELTGNVNPQNCDMSPQHVLPVHQVVEHNF